MYLKIYMPKKKILETDVLNILILGFNKVSYKFKKLRGSASYLRKVKSHQLNLGTVRYIKQ
jgi:hypothetical protein